MKSYDKYLTEDDDFFIEDRSSKSSLRQDFELFNEDEYKPQKVSRVKRIKDGWDVYYDKNIYFL
jgi:hypothetical protein